MTTLDYPLLDSINLQMVAAHVCMRLGKTDRRIGVGLVERYRSTIALALDMYGEEYAADTQYLAQVVVDAFKEEARSTYGDPLLVSAVYTSAA